MKKVSLVWIAILLFSLDAIAQKKPEKKQAPVRGANSSRADRKEDRARETALQRVQSLAERVMTFQDSEQKIRGLIFLADLVWTKGKDETYARQLFAKSNDILTAAANTAPAAGTVSQSTDNPGQLAPARWRALQTLYLQVVARHDAELAKKSAKSFALNNGADFESASNLRIANDLFMNGNSALAAEFAENGLKGNLRGTSRLMQVITLLDGLRANDEQAANLLFLKSLKFLTDDQATEANDVLLLGNYLFTSSLVPTQLPGAKLMVSPTRVGTISVIADVSVNRRGISAELVRPYLEVAAEVLARDATDIAEKQRRYAAAYLLLPKAQRFAPELVSRFSLIAASTGQDLAKATDADRKAATRAADSGPLDLETVQRKVDEITDTTAKDEYRLQAVANFYVGGNLNFAETLAEQMYDLPARKTLLEVISYARAVEALGRGHSDVAEQAAAKLDYSTLRILLRLQLATFYMKLDDRARASSSIETALSEANKKSDLRESILLLKGVETLAPIDKQRSLSAFREVVGLLNNSEVKNLEGIPVNVTARVEVGKRTVSLPLLLRGMSIGSFYGTMKALLANDVEGTIATVLQLKNESLLRQAMVALAGTLFDTSQPPAIAKGEKTQ
jgi:hypothetical protein